MKETPEDRLEALLRRMAEGDRDARDRLFELAMQQLRAQARSLRSRERRNHTWVTEELLSMAYLAKVPEATAREFQGIDDYVRWHTRVMRNLLVGHAKTRATRRTYAMENDHVVAALDGLVDVFEDSIQLSLMDLEGALEHLHETDPPAAQVLELSFFSGMDLGSIAEQLAVTRRRVQQISKRGREKLREYMHAPTRSLA